MKLFGKFLFAVPLVWVLLQVLDGGLTQYKSIQVGREMCDRFLHGHYPEYGFVERPPASYQQEGFHIEGLYDNTEWMRARTEESDIFDACTFKFKWRNKDEPFIGVLYFWLDKADQDHIIHSVFTGARVDYQFLFHRFLVWGVVYDTWGDFSYYDGGATMWEESYSRGDRIPLW